MCRFRNALAGLALLALAASAAAQPATYLGIGRAATPKEVAAWDIDVRPDFKGLPAGSGSVAKGQAVWEAKCAACHGVFGESNEVFSPLIGGVTPEDVKTGHVAALKTGAFPGRTTLMKVATVSTLWDYINRAMPWTQPKSLTVEEVYAVTAFLLNLSGVVAEDFTLSDKNIVDVQRRMPNRNGMTTLHAMWPGKEFGGSAKPDTRNTACMKNCETEVKVTSFLPDYARNQHGNLSQQNRLVGPQRGIDTTRPGSGDAEAQTPIAVAALAAAVNAGPVAASAAGAPEASAGARALVEKHACVACHAVDRKIVGPSFTEVARKHAGKADYLAGKIRSGGSGVWGAIPMPPQSLSDADARTIASWLASGAGK